MQSYDHSHEANINNYYTHNVLVCIVPICMHLLLLFLYILSANHRAFSRLKFIKLSYRCIQVNLFKANITGIFEWETHTKNHSNKPSKLCYTRVRYNFWAFNVLDKNKRMGRHFNFFYLILTANISFFVFDEKLPYALSCMGEWTRYFFLKFHFNNSLLFISLV